MIRANVLFRLIVEYLLLLPIFLVGGILLSSRFSLVVWLGSFLIAYLLGAVFKTLFEKKQWWIYAFFVVIAGVSLGFLIGDHWVTWIVLTIMYPVVIYRGIRYLSTAPENMLPISIMWVGGFITYFVAYLCFRYLDPLVDYLPIITVGGILYVIATLFLSNSEQLKRSTLEKGKTPTIHKTIKRQNKIYLSLTIVVIFLLAMGSFVQDSMLKFVRWLLNLLAGDGEIKEVPPDDAPPADPDMSGLFDDEVKEPSLFWEILEKITITLVYIGLAIVVILLLLLLLKKTRVWVIKLYHRIMNFLKTLGGRFSDDTENTLYEEEKESIFDFKEWTEEQKQRMKSFTNRMFKRKVNWNTLSNREKVRYVYRHFILQQADAKIESETPREVLNKLSNEPNLNAEKITALQVAYEKVRYGDQEISDTEVEEIHQLIQK